MTAERLAAKNRGQQTTLSEPGHGRSPPGTSISTACTGSRRDSTAKQEQPHKRLPDKRAGQYQDCGASRKLQGSARKAVCCFASHDARLGAVPEVTSLGFSTSSNGQSIDLEARGQSSHLVGPKGISSQRQRPRPAFASKGLHMARRVVSHTSQPRSGGSQESQGEYSENEPGSQVKLRLPIGQEDRLQYHADLRRRLRRVTLQARLNSSGAAVFCISAATCQLRIAQQESASPEALKLTVSASRLKVQ